MKQSLRHMLLLVVLAVAAGAAAQTTDTTASRDYLREKITQWNECRNVAITKTNGDVALYGSAGSGYACKDVPPSLAKTLKKLHDENKFIDDVQLTESGKWIVLFGKNSIRYKGIPDDLKEAIMKAQKGSETITSVTFNDAGDWILITSEYVRSGSDAMQQWLSAGAEDLGVLYAACVTDDAVIAVFEGGYRYYGEVPTDLLDALRESDIDVYRIKIAGPAWFFADALGKKFHANL